MESIHSLIAQANKHYALAAYEQAADIYAQASEESVNLHGEDAPENADVMFLYGRALVKVAMQKSEVLGGQAPQSTADKSPAKADTSKFSFEGDAEEEEEEEGDSEEEATTVEDDFQNAWEILDLARISFQKQLQLQESDQKAIKTRIADTYDLLGEVALESGMRSSFLSS